jgi:hypothetical protein
LPESNVTNQEDEISLFYCNKEVPQIFETPLEITSSECGSDDSNQFEVKRRSSIFIDS